MQNLSQWINLGRKYERWCCWRSCSCFSGSLGILMRRFYLQHSELSPSKGGTYIEGVRGRVSTLNPWFTVQNDVNRDIVSLVFSGLLRYNPETEAIEEDLATMRVSPDARVYTLTLKEGLQWHDIRLCLLVAFFFFFGIFLEFFFALTTSCRFARAYRSRTNLITKHSSLDLFYQ